MGWQYGALAAYRDYDNGYEMASLYYFNDALIGNPVQNVVWSGYILEIEHHAGEIGMYMSLPVYFSSISAV